MEEGKDSRRVVRVFGIGLIAVLAAGALAPPGPAGGRGGYGPGGGYPTPSPTPTATATATATVTATPTPSRRTRRLRRSIRGSGRGQTARSILKKGLLLNIQCSEDCRHVTQVFASKQQARKLLIKKKGQAPGAGRQEDNAAAGRTSRRTIRVKLSKKAKQGIKRMKRKHVSKLKLTIATSATDAVEERPPLRDDAVLQALAALNGQPRGVLRHEAPAGRERSAPGRRRRGR